MPLGREVGLGPGDIVLDGAQLPRKGTAPIFGRCLLWQNGRPSQLLLSSCINSLGNVDSNGYAQHDGVFVARSLASPCPTVRRLSFRTWPTLTVSLARKTAVTDDAVERERPISTSLAVCLPMTCRLCTR